MFYSILWAGVFIITLIVEGSTMQLISIWFAVGALGALLTTFAGGSFTIQAIVFVILSLILFLSARPLIKKIERKSKSHTNADSVVGMEGIVRDRIDTISGTGRVFVNGLSWAAKSDTVIEKDERILVLSIEGVTLTVVPAEKNKS